MKIQKILLFSLIALVVLSSTLAAKISIADKSSVGTININQGPQAKVGEYQELNITLLNETGDNFAYTGNIVLTTNTTETLTYSLLKGAGTLAGSTYAFDAVDVGFVSIGVKTTSTNAFSITGTANGSVKTVNLKFLPGELSTFKFEHDDSVIAGTPLSVKITALDNYENIKTNFNANDVLLKVNGNIPDVNTAPSLLSFTNGITNFNVNINEAKIHTLQVQKDIVSKSSSFTVLAGELSNFELDYNSFATVNEKFNIKIKAVDSKGNTIKDYTGTVLLSPFDDLHEWYVGSTLITTNNYNFKTLDNGEVTLSLLTTETGSLTIEFNDIVNSVVSSFSTTVRETTFSLNENKGLPGDTITIMGEYFTQIPSSIILKNIESEASTTVSFQGSFTDETTGKITGTFVLPTIIAGNYDVLINGKTLENALEVEEKIELTMQEIGTQYVNPKESTTKIVPLTLTNNGNIDLNGVSITSTNLTYGINLITGLTLSQTTFDLSVGETKTIQLTIPISSTQEYGTYTGQVKYSANEIIDEKTQDLTLIVSDETVELTVPTSFSISARTDGVTTKTFTVTNKGNILLENVMASYSGDISSRITLTSSRTISPGSSAVYEFKIDSTSVSEGTYTGTITLANERVSKTIPVTITLKESKIGFYRVEMSINDGSSSRIDEFDTVRYLEPGDKLEIDVQINNLFGSREDELRDVEVTAIIFDIDDGGDLEEISTEFDIDPGKRVRLSDVDEVLKFEIPYDVEEGTYDILIELRGYDEDGELHESEFEFSIQVRKERYKIVISDITLFPSVATCQSYLDLTIKLTNIGTRDTDNAMIKLEGKDLRFEEIETRISLDEGNSITKTYRVSIPSSLREGSYLISARAYYEPDRETDYQYILLKKEKCISTTPDDKDEEDDDSDDKATENDFDDFEDFDYKFEGKESKEFRDSTAYIVLLSVISLGVIAGLFYLIGALLL